jgi:hypothetical protein
MLKTMIFYSRNMVKSPAGLVYLPFEIFQMKRISILFLCLAVAFSCKKKKEEEPNPEPEPVKTGTVHFTVQTYDSLGQLKNNHSGVTLTLYQGSGLSVMTDSSGKLTINNVNYGEVIPVLQKTGYEGAPVRLTLNSESASLTVPCAQYSPYKVQNLTGFVSNPDSIAISFSLNKPLPMGKSCKIAVLFSDTTISPGNPGILDTVRIFSQVVQKLNVANLPNLKSALIVMKKDKNFRISAVPVSYGIYFSNVFGKQVLIGENPLFPAQLTFNKNW